MSCDSINADFNYIRHVDVIPEVLKEIIDSGSVDYVAVDIKRSPARYDRVCGREGMFEKVSRTIALLLSGKVDYEFSVAAWTNSPYWASYYVGAYGFTPKPSSYKGQRRAEGEVQIALTLAAPDDSPAIVTLSGSPPKAAMFSRTQVSTLSLVLP